MVGRRTVTGPRVEGQVAMVLVVPRSLDGRGEAVVGHTSCPPEAVNRGEARTWTE